MLKQKLFQACWNCKVAPELIIERLLDDRDKSDIVRGVYTNAQLECAIKAWKEQNNNTNSLVTFKLEKKQQRYESDWKTRPLQKPFIRWNVDCINKENTSQ